MDDIQSIDQLEKECEITAVHSSGPGGQNVNKTATKIRLLHLPSRITITCSRTRSQLINKKLALEKLREKLIRNAQKAKVRIETRKPAGLRQRELEEKKQRSEIKKLRQKLEMEE